MLAMTVGESHEFIQDSGVLELRCHLIAFTESFEHLVVRVLADLAEHAAPPEVGNILVRQQFILGNRIGESMRAGFLNVADHARMPRAFASWSASSSRKIR